MGGREQLEAFWTVQRLVRDRHESVRKVGKYYTAERPKGKKPSSAEHRAWRESVYKLATTLDNLGPGQVRMIIEYLADGQMNHIGMVLVGQHASGRLTYAVIELKQWGSIERPTVSKTAGLCAPFRAVGNSTLCRRCATDLVYAPFSEMDDLRRHHSMFDDRYVNLVGAAYLHNLMDRDHQWISQVSPRPGIPTFTARLPRDLEEFLTANLSPASGTEAAQELLRRRRSSNLLNDETGSVVNGYTRFSLFEHQLRSVRAIADATAVVGAEGAKKAFVIEGRPGTGKSLVALTALGKVLQAGHSAAFVSDGVASRDTSSGLSRDTRRPSDRWCRSPTSSGPTNWI